MTYFRLRDIYYSIIDPTVTVTRSSDGISLNVTLDGNTNDKKKTDCLFNISLVFDVKTEFTNIYDLENEHIKKLSPEAGKFIVEKSGKKTEYDLDMTKITFKEISNDNIIVHWSGEVTLPYNKKYGKNIPFDLECKAKVK